MPRTRNPFARQPAGYNDPGMAAAAQSLGLLLTAGESPYEQQSREAKTALTGAQTRFNEAGAAKRTAEAAEIKSRSRFLNDDEMFNTAWAEEGGDPRLPTADIQAQVQADPQLRARLARRIGAYRASNTLPGKTTYEQLQKGMTVGADRSLGEQVLGGEVTAGRAGEAMAARAGKPLRAVQGDTNISLYQPPSVGAMVTTELGGSKVKSNEAQSRERDAHAGAYKSQARASDALAGERGARTEQIRGETKSGVKVGAPVVNEAGAYVAPRDAVGQKAGAKPAATRPGAAPKLPFSSGKVLDEEINAQFGEFKDQLTADDKVAIRARASELYPEVGNTTEAVRRARVELGYGIEEKPGRLWGTNRSLKRPTPGQALTGGRPRSAADLSDDELKKALGL